MVETNRIAAIELQELDASTFIGTFLELCSGLPKACSIIRIINASDVGVAISYDGVTVNDYLEAHDTLMLPVQTVALPPQKIVQFPIGFKVYINGLVGTGYVKLAGYYQP